MLVIQGYQDDISANETEFADMAERINLIGLITDVAQNYKDPELQDVIDYTLERANDSRELILNLESRKKEGSKTSPSREGGSVGDEEEMARKRRAAAAASRRYAVGLEVIFSLTRCLPNPKKQSYIYATILIFLRRF